MKPKELERVYLVFLEVFDELDKIREERVLTKEDFQDARTRLTQSTAEFVNK